MSFNLFIVPLTMILVEIVKKFEVESKWLALIACGVGAVLGAVWAVVQVPMPNAVNWVGFITQGLVYGAAAAGIYDITQSKNKSKEVIDA